MALQFLYTFMIIFVTSCLLQGFKVNAKGKNILANAAGYSLVAIITAAIFAVWGF